MRRLGHGVTRRLHLGLTTAVVALYSLPAFAQDSSFTSTSQTTTTTATSSEFVSDWRLWALVGAVILVILVIALTRRGGGDSTTIVK